jgi:hypothetical protein
MNKNNKPKAQGDDEGKECESYVYAVAYIGFALH